jgi:hypothetical protein
MFNKEDVV